MPHNLEIKYESNIKMKSFKNFYIRNNNLVQLQNTSFESPLITTISYVYYDDLSLAQKQNFKWVAGGNLMIQLGPILINDTTVWGFTVPFPSGNQFLALQSTSFIEQSMYMTTGLHTISFYYHTRIGGTGNPINIVIDNSIIGTTSSVVVNSWTLLSQTFTIPISGTVTVKLEGTLSTTTGIDNIIVI